MKLITVLMPYLLWDEAASADVVVSCRWSKGGFEEASLGGLVQPLAVESSDPSAFLSLPRAAGLPQVVMSALQASTFDNA